VLVGAKPARVARGEELQDLGAEEFEICGIEVERLEEQFKGFENLERSAGRAPVEAIPGVGVNHRDGTLGGRLEAIGHGPAAAHRDALHEVDDVLVEARIEAKAMLAGQRFAPTAPGARDRLAARLAAPIRPPLVQRDSGATIAEFVRGGQTCDATADDDYLHGHSLLSLLASCSRCRTWRARR
jgi:hypothetical protein